MQKEHLFANWRHCYPVVFVCCAANALPCLLIESSLGGEFLTRNSAAMRYRLSHRCLLNRLARTGKVISPWPDWDAEGTCYWPHLWELSSRLFVPQYRLRLLCIRSHARSDPKIIGLWLETTLSPGRPLGLSKKVKAFVFQFSWDHGCTGPFRTHHYNLPQ